MGCVFCNYVFNLLIFLKILQHFVDGQPTKQNPDPVPAIPYDRVTPVRPPPKARSLSEPPKKKKRLELEETWYCPLFCLLSHVVFKSKEKTTDFQ